ncbi:nucleotide sugar dehydrogenase [Persephonella atlantica]|uniref:Nucleotide sugar dehydrogenase n=1 Tax=Persephonella atlantica TaxID=2699429 RepID=A0ABS1GK47_9AQUI|nr:nucleotide sugar dehydrogenase [Persephonella atlantica]MBK3333210.1 nucleotide sugar dehydrogenase [Persephonella atlantica]
MDYKIAVIGLGYVGLPLAVLLDKKHDVIGFDINSERIKELKEGYDRTREVEPQELKNCSVEFTDNPEKISQAKVIIITVPTPIDKHNIPDLRPIKSATRTVGRYMQKGSIVVYESTVYPGLTEEECVPILEQESGLKWKKDFNVGYSPERVNPGDKQHTIDKIVKVVAGDTPEITEFLAQLYGSVITAGVHKAPDIKTAEAAKVIENTQRDLNIALMNELSVIFNKMGIDTKAVLEAASTKWNFLRFEPGLVGGHCIGVDPYYLTFKAQAIGHHPEVILAGRRINDYMGKFVAENTVKNLIKAGKAVKGSKVLILGLTFKENISDIRNTKVIDVYNELKEYGINVYIYDPYAYPEEVKEEYGIELLDNLEKHKPYDAVVVAVKHRPFIEEIDFKKYKELMNNGDKPVLIDIKGLYSREKALKEGFLYWRL